MNSNQFTIVDFNLIPWSLRYRVHVVLRIRDNDIDALRTLDYHGIYCVFSLFTFPIKLRRGNAPTRKTDDRSVRQTE